MTHPRPRKHAAMVWPGCPADQRVYDADALRHMMKVVPSDGGLLDRQLMAYDGDDEFLRAMRELIANGEPTIVALRMMAYLRLPRGGTRS